MSNADIRSNALLKQERFARAQKELLVFTRFTKQDYEINWHHRLLCTVLDKFARKEIKRLMIFLPPRVGKSELVSRRLPAFLHGLNPKANIMSATYNSELASDLTNDVQAIMETEEYRQLFPNVFIPSYGSRKGTRNSQEHSILHKIAYGKYKVAGAYRSQGIGGTFTGRGADYLIIDDPIKNGMEADSAAFRATLHKAYSGALRTRLEKDGSILITMTRWHEDDLAGRLLLEAKSNPDADQWAVISLPMLCEDPTFYMETRPLNEPLWPNKYNFDECNRLKNSVGTRNWTALYQQRPSAEEGNIFKRAWWKYYSANPKDLRLDTVIQSWDLATKDKEQGSYTAGLVLGRKGMDYYVLDLLYDQIPFTAQTQALLSLSGKWPQAGRKLIEDKANGPAVMDMLKHRLTGIIPIEPDGDKVARANAASPAVESGNWHLPDPLTHPWVHTFVSQLADFPNAKDKDIVDAFSQGARALEKMGPTFMPIAGHSNTTHNR